MNTYYILEQLHQLVHKCAKWKKVTTFTQFEQKNTHISGCKLVYKYTIAIVIVQICTITVAWAYNILIIFSLSSLPDSHLPLSLSSAQLSHLINLSSSSFRRLPPPPMRTRLSKLSCQTSLLPTTRTEFSDESVA